MKHISFVGTRQQMSWFFANTVCQPVSPPPDFLSTSGHSSLCDPSAVLKLPLMSAHRRRHLNILLSRGLKWKCRVPQLLPSIVLAHALASLAMWTWLRSTVEVICYRLCKSPAFCCELSRQWAAAPIRDVWTKTPGVLSFWTHTFPHLQSSMKLSILVCFLK